MPEIDPRTGGAVCPYGTQIKPSFDELVIDALSGAALGAAFASGPIGPILVAAAALGAHWIVVEDLCAAPPPLPEDWTLSDTIALLNIQLPDPRVWGKLLDWAAVGAWKLACECKPVQLPGWSSMACGKMNFGGGGAATSDPLPYRADNTGGFRLVYSAVPAGATRVDINIQSRHGDGSWWTELLVRCEPGGHPYADSFEFTKVGALVDETTTAMRLVCGTGDPLPIVSLDWCLYYEPIQITAPEPVGPSGANHVLPLPPDYSPPGPLAPAGADLADLHELRKFVMPSSWIPGAPFVVSGAGSHAVPYGTTGLAVSVAGIGSGGDHDAGDPPVHYALGWIAPTSTAGARPRWKLDKVAQLFWGMYGTETQIQYNIYAPGVATITPLLRP